AQAMRFLNGKLEQSAPLGTHEERANRRTNSLHRIEIVSPANSWLVIIMLGMGPLTCIEDQSPGNALALHFFQVSRDSFPSGIAVKPPPIAPWLGRLRRSAKTFGQHIGPGGHLPSRRAHGHQG